MSSRSCSVTMTPDADPDTSDVPDAAFAEIGVITNAPHMTIPAKRATKERRGLIAPSR
jgi:hypothetical protein